MGAQPIAGIVPKGPGPSLLTAAGRLPAGTNWQSGVSFRQTHCFTAGAWPECPAADQEKDDATSGGVATFNPFTGYVPFDCDWVTQENAEGRFDPETRDQLDAASAGILASELWTGAINAGGLSVSPSLQSPFPGETDEFDETHIINSGGALNPVDAIGRLVEAYSDTTLVGGATLHVPTALVTRLISDYDIVLNGQVFSVPGQAYVSPGPGYPRVGNTGPRVSGDTNGLGATAGQAWVFITGPVEYEMGQATLEPEAAEARWFNRRTNKYYVLAERRMIYRFDPCAVWAALVTLPTAS